MAEIDAWPFGSCRPRPTLIMSDSQGRLHKIIITQQWSELPHWHFHTTSDLSGNLRGHDQGRGSERAPLISQLTSLSCHFLLSSVFYPVFFPFFLYFPHHLCVCLSHTLIFTSGAQLSHLLSWEGGKRKQEKSIGEIGESH